MIGRCNLCTENKELQRVCHVIPDFFYRESNLYNENHNVTKLDLSTLLENNRIKIISKKQKTGEFDEYKLCKDCDCKIIGKYESYTREHLYSSKLPSNKRILVENDPTAIRFKYLDYKIIKSLFLSILWRADISDRKLFSEIDLGYKKEEIRKIILSGNPGSDIEFPIFFMNTAFDKSISKDYLFHPIKMKVGKEDGFMFAFGGMIIIYSLGIDGIDEKTLDYRLKEDGTFSFIKVPNGETWKLIKDWYKKK